MLVLHVIPSLSVIHGGPSRAIFLIERSLGGSGVQMEVATTDDDGPGQRLAARVGRDGIEVAVPQGSGLVRRFFAKRTEFYKISPSLAVWLARHARDYDVIHIHALFSFSSLAAAWAARRAHIPYIVRPLGTLTRYGVEKRRPWLKQFSLKWIEGPILRHASAVHFTAEAERIEAEALGMPFRAVVIPLAVEASVQGSGTAFVDRFPELAGQPYLLFLSRLDRKKNLEGLLGAMAILAGTFPNLMLVVAGDGDPDYVASLKRLAVGLGIVSRVVWVGFVDGELKYGALAGATVFVLPSHSENFGIAVAEALAAGLPCVVGHGVAIAPAVEGAGAGLAVGTDAESISKGVEHYLVSEGARQQAGEAARELARREYSVEKMGERLVALYESIVDKK